MAEKIEDGFQPGARTICQPTHIGERIMAEEFSIPMCNEIFVFAPSLTS